MYWPRDLNCKNIYIYLFHIHLMITENHVSCCNSGPQCALSGGSMAFQCHISCEHRVSFSTAAGAQQRLMRVRYAEAIGGGLIAD